MTLAEIEAIADQVAIKIAPSFHQSENRWNVKNVAEYLNSSPKNVYNRLTDLKDPIPHYKIGNLVRFEPHEVREWHYRNKVV